jgi:non-ribosomal peptide synthetase component E (peptide arylation enzyme)
MTTLNDIQVPNSIKKIANEVKELVLKHPTVHSVHDFSYELQFKWEKVCDHELYHQDIERYIGDVATYRNFNNPSMYSF